MAGACGLLLLAAGPSGELPVQDIDTQGDAAEYEPVVLGNADNAEASTCVWG